MEPINRWNVEDGETIEVEFAPGQWAIGRVSFDKESGEYSFDGAHKLSSGTSLDGVYRVRKIESPNEDLI